MDEQLTPEEIVAAMGHVGSAHVSVSRGALPFVVPATIRVTSDEVLVESDHPSVVNGAHRSDIAAIQVDAVLDETLWSLLATGPLHTSADGPAMARATVLLGAECLSSPHGHRIDPLLRSGLAGSA